MQFMFSRKSGIVLAALLGVQLILPASGWALTGRDVALKADQVDTSRTSDMSMAMIIKRGDQQLVRFMAMKKKKFPDSEKQHIRFLEPGDIRNTAYLTWSYRDINKDDDMWVYMPAESLVRRISGGSKKGSFMRSDYANEDISRREVDKDTYTLLPDEALSGVDCHVLEAKAVFPEKTNYSKRIIWIDPKNADTAAKADELYALLTGMGLDVLLDDREERPGVKFKDADLVGLPMQVVVGGKGLARGIVEVKNRKTGEKGELPVEGFAEAFAAWRKSVLACWGM